MFRRLVFVWGISCGDRGCTRSTVVAANGLLLRSSSSKLDGIQAAVGILLAWLGGLGWR